MTKRRVWLAGWVLTLIVAGVVWVKALPTNTQFELEGNATVEGPGDDWANTVPVKTAGSEAIVSTFIADGSGNATIFTGGGSKDIRDISQWAWKDDAGGLPDKDNITNAYAAAYVNAQNPDDLTFYFGADRFANDGDAQMGFWFFKNQVQLGPTGNFVGPDGVTVASHSDGDVLVLVNMSNGGAVARAAAFRWVNGGLVAFATELDNAKCGSNSDPNLCVISNPGDSPAPWAYTPKAGTPGTFPTFSFIEGGVNVSILNPGSRIGCFSSFLAETRSSTVANSTLKDFALGQFDTCKLDISKICPTVTYDAGTNLLTYTALVTVKNSGIGTVFDVTVTDTASGQPPATQTLASLGTGVTQVFTFTFVQTPSPTMPNPPSDTASVSAAAAPGGDQIVHAGPVSATCQQVSFDALLSITKTCETRLEVSGGKVVVAVLISGNVCNNPPSDPTVIPEAISGITVTDDPALPEGTITIGTLATGQCAPYTSKYFPGTLFGGSTLPHDQQYEDTASARGTGVATGQAKLNTATARCPLCP